MNSTLKSTSLLGNILSITNLAHIIYEHFIKIQKYKEYFCAIHRFLKFFCNVLKIHK